jgi:DUF1680 family protein
MGEGFWTPLQSSPVRIEESLEDVDRTRNLQPRSSAAGRGQSLAFLSPRRTRLEGHAVRSVYASSGATDYYLETGDPKFRETLEKIWKTPVSSTMYVSSHGGTCFSLSVRL